MTSSSKLIKEINRTDAAIESHLETIDEGLPKPACYALPLAAFVLGLSFHKVVPSPIPLIAWFSKVRLF